MRFILQILIGVALSVVLITASYSQTATDTTQANNQFAFDLYSHLSTGEKNIFFAPYSLSSALSMTYEGARNQTADEMRTVLHLPSDDIMRRIEDSELIERMNSADKPYELSTANALWVQKAFPFKEDYLKLVKYTYYAEARNLDFFNDPEGSRVSINNWVLEKTKNRINNLLPPKSIKKDTRLILTNAVYFKGKWSIPFKKEATKQDAFWISQTESVQTAMMGLVGKSFKYAENEQAQIIELPYKGEDLSMLIILPLGKDIQPIEKIINESTLKQWDETLTKQPVNVFIPKFKFDADYQMKDILVGMGMKNAFNKKVADFSAMAYLKPDEHLYIDQVYHKAWIDVNEEGTEAAAATAVVVRHSKAIMRNPTQPKIFRADHPFIFVIQDNKTGHILFIGRVSDPR